jgi:hypothetical protein
LLHLFATGDTYASAFVLAIGCVKGANERDGNTAIMMVTVRRVARISPSLVITLYRVDASIGAWF